MKEKQLDLWVDFNQPDQITQDLSHPDTIEIHFKKGNMFMDRQDFTQLSKNLTLEYKIVPQMSQAQF